MHGDIIILHKCTKNHDHILYCSWNMVRDRCDWYFSFWAIFCLFTLLTAWKMKIKKKLKKTPWDIVILHQCTKTHNHMLYYFCDMHGGWNFYFSFLTIFWPFIPLTAWKNKISKNEKMHGDIITLHKCSKNHDHMLYCSFGYGVWWM